MANTPEQIKSEFEEKIIKINRVSKKTKGGNKISFSVLAVIGDKKGKVGVGFGKAPDTVSAIQKAIRLGKRNLFKISLKGNTIPHEVYIKRGAAKILLKPAPDGTGVIAGGAVRAVVDAAGIKNIVAKILGTRKKISNVYATIAALKKLKGDRDGAK